MTNIPRLRKQLDQQLTAGSLLGLPTPPAEGWLRTLRASLGVRGRQLATKLGITKQSLAILEQHEVEGKISLNNLRRVADALGCDVYYVVVPRQPLETMLQKRAKTVATSYVQQISHSMVLEGQGLSDTELQEQVNDVARKLADTLHPTLWDEPRT